MTTTSSQPPRRGGRPGAMTMAMQAVQNRPTGPKVLRIALMQGGGQGGQGTGKIVEERIIRKRETVTVGSSEKNHFIIAAPGLSSRFELFQLVGNDYILNFTDEMRGRVSLAGGVQDLGELRSSGGARKAQGYYQVKLTDNSRGKITIGETTFLFHFVVPPPVQPRPQLPAAVVGGFIAGIDWLFTAFIMFSFMTHFGFIIYLENADWPVEASLATVPDSIVEAFFEPPPEPEPEEEVPQNEEAEESEEAEEEEVAENETEREESPEEAQERQQEADSEARLAVEEEVNSAMNQLIGSLSSEDGALQDLLREGGDFSNSADIMDQASGTSIATNDSTQMRERAGGDTIGSGRGNLGDLAGSRSERATQSRTEGEQVVERVIRGRVNASGPEEEGGAGVFDPDIVTRQIRTRIRSIQACYERELRNNPTLNGRVLVRFNIQPTGTVSGASAPENTTGSPAVAACVVNTISRFRFNPGPEGGSVTFAYPFVFAPQN